MAAAAYSFTEHASYRTEHGALRPWNPNRYKIANPLDAVVAIVTPRGDRDPRLARRREQQRAACLELEPPARRRPPRTARAYAAVLELDQRPVRLRAGCAAPGTLAPLPGRALAARRRLCPAVEEWFGYVIFGRLDMQSAFKKAIDALNPSDPA
jgi:hypothetical protein